jgi:hypothetical protein
MEGSGSRYVQTITDPDPKNLRVLQILIQIYSRTKMITIYVYLGFFHDAIQTQRSLKVFADV